MTAVPIDHSPRRGRQPEPDHRRTGNKCRAGSKLADPLRKWPRLSRKEADLRLFALDLQLEQQRQKGRRIGAEGTICEGARRLYKFVLNGLVKNGSKGLTISAETLARILGATKKAIHRWKAQLQAFGFLDWELQVRSTGREGLRGPQVEQSPNAYYSRLSRAAVEAVAKVRKKMGWKPDPRTVEPHELAVMAPEALSRESRLQARLAAERARLNAACAPRPDPRSSG